MKRTGITDINTPENYDEIYFGVRNSQLLANDEFLSVLNFLSKGVGSVLDVGCGLGRYFSAFKGNAIYGTELSTKCIDRLKTEYTAAQIIQWFAGNQLPYSDNFFGLVWCGELLEHVENPSQVVEEIYRVLKPGSMALFTTPAGNHHECPEHLWFFDKKDIEDIFGKYYHESGLSDDKENFIILMKKL